MLVFDLYAFAIDCKRIGITVEQFKIGLESWAIEFQGQSKSVLENEGFQIADEWCVEVEVSK